MHPLLLNVSADRFPIHHYSKFDIIFNEGELCTKIGLVIKGTLQIQTITYTEKEYNIVTIHENETFGETLIFSNHPYYLGNVICTKDADIIMIDKKHLLSLLQQDDNFLKNYLNIITNKSMAYQKRIKILVQKQIRDKILFYLFEEAKQLQSFTIPIKSKEELATLLNIPRPSLSRELMLMRHDHLIDYNRQFIFLIDYCNLDLKKE